MNRRSAFAVLLLAIAIAAFATVKTEKTDLKEVKDDKYKPGHVWSYKTRPGEETSTLTILRVEEAPKGKRIVHIRVDGIRLKNCTGGPEPDTVEHMPFAKEMLDASVIKKERTVAIPHFDEGYSQWRKGWDEGKAGFYTITVSEAIEVMQKTFDSGLRCSH